MKQPQVITGLVIGFQFFSDSGDVEFTYDGRRCLSIGSKTGHYHTVIKEARSDIYHLQPGLHHLITGPGTQLYGIPCVGCLTRTVWIGANGMTKKKAQLTKRYCPQCAKQSVARALKRPSKDTLKKRVSQALA